MYAAASPLDAAALVVPATDERPALDLGRDVHALLGVVFDRVDLERATAQLRRCVAERRRCFLSTPNVNFIAAATRDPAFRGSVLRSDLSVADGFPIVRAARWMAIDLPGRVAGADLFERLQAGGRSASQPPIRLYLFGGPPGVGARAAQRINAQAGGFECVGHDEGGFGDVEAMSTPEILARINASGADFVLVALGAKKGQAWIERNRAALAAPVISHLGAVINFAAGSVSRAPSWLQSLGGEWLWRIAQEPQLWRRYWDDGRLLLSTVVTRLLPWSLRRAVGRVPAGANRPPQVTADATPWRLSGDWRAAADLLPLRRALADALRRGRPVELDLSASPALGSAALGLIAIVDAWQVTPRVLRADTVDAAVHADLRAHGMEHLLAPVPAQRGAGNQ